MRGEWWDFSGGTWPAPGHPSMAHRPLALAALFSVEPSSCHTSPEEGWTASVLMPGPPVYLGALPTGAPPRFPLAQVPGSPSVPGRPAVPAVGNPCWHAALAGLSLALGGSPRGVLTGPTCLPRWSTTSLPSLASFCSEVSSWLLETAGEGGSEVQRAPRLWGRWSRG